MSFFTAEFVIRAHYAGFDIAEIPVPHYARKIGSTNIFYVSKLFLICLKQFIGMLRMRQEVIQKGLFHAPLRQVKGSAGRASRSLADEKAATIKQSALP